jgi:hypothetical protein
VLISLLWETELTLESWQYQDPMIVLEQKQAQQIRRTGKCGKCVHYAALQIGTETHHGCTLKRRNWQACTFFEAKKENQ